MTANFKVDIRRLVEPSSHCYGVLTENNNDIFNIVDIFNR